MKANYKRHALLAILLNVAIMNIAQSNEEEIDAEFLEFLAEMEEVTGSGFDRWLEVDSEDMNNMSTKEIDQNIQSSEK